MTRASPTFCLACQDGALCWRSCGGAERGGAVSVSIELVPHRNVNIAARANTFPSITDTGFFFLAVFFFLSYFFTINTLLIVTRAATFDSGVVERYTYEQTLSANCLFWIVMLSHCAVL